MNAGAIISRRASRTAAAVAVSLSMLGGAAMAQGTAASAPVATSSTMAATTLGKTDQRFITEAAAGGMFEVAASKLAVERARSEDLKAYAQHLVADHEKANAELMAIAAQKGVKPPAALPKTKQSQLDRMAQLQGNAFDVAYVQTVGIKAHREDIVMFERTSKTSKDAELKAFATKTLPALREHLATAQGIPAKASARLQDPIASAPRP